MKRDAAFELHRSHLLGIAYRMLGELAGAEDIVQEAWLRWSRSDREEIHDVRPWLSTVTVRLALDALRAARRRRETYVGPWLPEPLLPDDMRALAPSSPEDRAELASDLSLALLHVLERLAPEERAAFIMHDAFDCGYDEIATVLDKSEEACRKLVSRARARVRTGRSRQAATAQQHRTLMERFSSAVMASDQKSLLAIFADDVVFYSDGGGRVPAALNPIYGANNVTRLILGLTSKFPPNGVANIRPTEASGQFALAVTFDNEPYTLITLDVSDDLITSIYVIRNPEKLSRFERTLRGDAMSPSSPGSSASA